MAPQTIAKRVSPLPFGQCLDSKGSRSAQPGSRDRPRNARSRLLQRAARRYAAELSIELVEHGANPLRGKASPGNRFRLTPLGR